MGAGFGGSSFLSYDYRMVSYLLSYIAGESRDCSRILYVYYSVMIRRFMIYSSLLVGLVRMLLGSSQGYVVR